MARHAARTDRTDRTHRLDIDWTACQGHGLCAELLPERITLDEWGYPLLGEGPPPGHHPETGPQSRRGLPGPGPQTHHHTGKLERVRQSERDRRSEPARELQQQFRVLRTPDPPRPYT